MSSRAKGNRTRRKAEKFLRNRGFLVDQVELGGKFRKSKDLFAGVCTLCWGQECECENQDIFPGFDLIALKADRIAFIQVKTNTPSTQAPYKAFAKRFVGPSVGCWVMTWYDRDGWRIQSYKSDGTIDEDDLRKSKSD